MRHITEFMSTRSQLYDKNKQHEALTGAMTPLRITKVREDTSAFLLSLDLRWHACRVHNFGGPLWINRGQDGRPYVRLASSCTGSESENIKD